MHKNNENLDNDVSIAFVSVSEWWICGSCFRDPLLIPAVVWTLSLPLINSFNETDAVFRM